MRKVVGIALLAIVIALLLLSQNNSQPLEKLGQNASNSVSFGMYSSEAADFGNSSAAVMHLFLFSEEKESVFAFCSNKPIQKNILILDHASAPGVPFGFDDIVAKEMAGCGFSSRTASIEDALGSENAIIIASTGAVPEELIRNQEQLEEKNSRVIVLDMLSGRVIDMHGRLNSSNESHWFETVEMLPGNEEEAAKQAAKQALFIPNAGAVEYGGKSGNFTLGIEFDGNKSYCRAIYIGEGNCRFADTGEISKPEGILVGPKRAFAGKEEVYEFSIAENEEVGRNLDFFAAAYEGRAKSFEEEIAGGKIQQGWASRFLLNFSKGGKYTVKMLDQFGRLHASAYTEVMGLDVKPVLQDSNKYEFYAKVGDEPVNGKFDVWIDEGESKQYYASNGTLLVWAAPAAGQRTMHFDFEGLQADYGFYSEGGGFLENYMRYAVPAIIFLAAVFLLARAGKKANYTITFAQPASAPPKMMAVSPKELEVAWKRADRKFGGFGLAMNADEIADELHKMKGEGAGIMINHYSLLQALRKLVQQGKFAESDGTFALSSKLGNFSAKELKILRLVHDIMLEHGLKFKRGKRITVKSGELEIVLFRGKKSVLQGIGKPTRAVIFETREQSDLFEKQLGSNETTDTRIKLAVSNNKVLFVAATRQELEAILP